jgi:hypothetical protein
MNALRKLMLAASLMLAGCNPNILPQPDATLAQLEDARAYTAASFALLQPGDSGPSPPDPPAPTPGETCARCDGTGRIKPDGRIEIACPDCDGTGKTTVAVNWAWMYVEQNTAPQTASLTSPSSTTRHDATAAQIKNWENRIDALQKRLDENLKLIQNLKSQQPTVAPIQWVTSLETLKRRCQETGLPGLIHFYTESCAPCVQMDRNVFADQSVAAYVNANFVPARINAEWLSAAERTQWGISAVPSERLVRSDWSRSKFVESATSPADYLANLRAALPWTRERTTTSRVINSAAVMPAVYYWQPSYPSQAYYGGGYYVGNCVSGSCF